MNKKNIVICMCKHPEAGLVKSRLASTIGTARAAKVYGTLLQFTLTTVKQLGFTVFLYCHPDIHHLTLKRYSNEFGFQLRNQAAGSLGCKMHQAMCSHMDHNTNVVLIGSDCLETDADYILDAFTHLETHSEIVLGPAEDGGYALLGATKISASLFQGITWSSKDVLKQTKDRISRLGWTYHCLPKVRDLDTYEDYAFFLKHEKFRHLFTSYAQ